MGIHWVQPSNTTSRIVVTTLLGLAQIATFYRLIVRIRLKRYWMDDTWAVVALGCSFMLLVDMWIRTDLSQSRSTRIVAYWLVSLSFTNTLWASRMSIIFSVIRIIPEQSKLRRITHIVAALFALGWIGLLIQKVFVCASDKSWYTLAKPQCHLGTGVAVLELITDLFADLALAIIPISLLYNIQIPSIQRRMLIIIFAASLLTTVASIVHAIYLLGPSGLLEGTSAQVEAAVALLVADAGIVVTAFYRLIRKEGVFENQPYTYKDSNSEGIRMHKSSRDPMESAVVFASRNPGLETVHLSHSTYELDDKPRAPDGYARDSGSKVHSPVLIRTDSDMEQAEDSNNGHGKPFVL
ncbi:hypothetical protein C8J57DRAFT_209690 [Mycena rebaudengoi]|nr:hypothetical protein C8J57DRAFT_209690 [Mycena rebaudengoi]